MMRGWKVKVQAKPVHASFFLVFEIMLNPSHSDDAFGCDDHDDYLD